MEYVYCKWVPLSHEHRVKDEFRSAEIVKVVTTKIKQFFCSKKNRFPFSEG